MKTLIIDFPKEIFSAHEEYLNSVNTRKYIINNIYSSVLLILLKYYQKQIKGYKYWILVTTDNGLPIVADCRFDCLIVKTPRYNQSFWSFVLFKNVNDLNLFKLTMHDKLEYHTGTFSRIKRYISNSS